MRPSNNLKNKTPSDKCWRVQRVCMKVQGHDSLEPSMKYKKPLMNQSSLWPF